MSKRIGSSNFKKVSKWKDSIMQARRKVAEERNSAYAKLTAAQKIAKLDALGHTATRQRAKLQTQLGKENEAKKAKAKV